MKIFSVNDPAFARYGRVVEGYDVKPLVEALQKTPLPEGTQYVAKDEALQVLPAAQALAMHLYGGMPAQFGWCNGHNTQLNCLEYHRDSEFNLGTEDFILLLAKQDEIRGGKLDTSLVKAFRVPAGTLVEVYATTLHYTPCHTQAEKGFRVLVALADGTNAPRPELPTVSLEDRMLCGCNKWVLAHPDSAKAKAGRYAGLTGENIDIAALL